MLTQPHLFGGAMVRWKLLWGNVLILAILIDHCGYYPFHDKPYRLVPRKHRHGYRNSRHRKRPFICASSTESVWTVSSSHNANDMLAKVPVLDPPEFDDPLFTRQWYLFNRNHPGHDINVIPVWKEGITGKGVVIALIDDGVDYEHADLKDSFRKDLSYDFNGGKLLPIPDPDLRDYHGTRCAGQLVAKPNNGVCGVGIAPAAQISAIRILSGAVSSKNEGEAVIHRYGENHIYSCSWGPADDGKAIDAPDVNVLRAFIEGLIKGRDGLGSVYVFAAGNGKVVDNCNYDGYANGIFSLTVGAIDHDHKMPRYMEPCAAQLVVSYSSNDEYRIATTDLGGDRCTIKHGGTSAAAPMVTGILALVLQVRPDLTWRDLRYLCVQTAMPISEQDDSWVRNGAERMYSWKFGFGKIDAHKIVSAAKTWKSVQRQTVKSLPVRKLDKVIENESFVIDSIEISENMMRKLRLMDITALEYVTIRLNVKHDRRGDLLIDITSPAGTTIPLVTRRPLDESTDGLRGITMMTVAFWGEPINVGTWTLKFSNGGNSTGCIIDYRLAFWGAARKDLKETDEEYAQMFLNNYYPPSEEYFVDKNGLFNPIKEESIVPKRKKGLIWKIVIALLALFAPTFLVLLFLSNILRIIRQRRQPLTRSMYSYNNTGVYMLDDYQSVPDDNLLNVNTS